VVSTDDDQILILAPGTWCSAYMCEAFLAYDPWSILFLANPTIDL
jgi:hypothetical protein